jgi:hypothetical protein
LFITSPNNPDGSLISAADLKRCLDLPVLVVLDEAYIEFASRAGGWAAALAHSTEVPQRQNLVVLRTFQQVGRACRSAHWLWRFPGELAAAGAVESQTAL